MIPTPPLPQVVRLDCIVCDKSYDPADVDYTCPDHGAVGSLDVVYDYDYVAANLNSDEYSMWRFGPLLPVGEDSPKPPLQIGWTPLYQRAEHAKALGLKNLWVKDDSRLPTASFKDRASAIAVVKGREKQAEFIATASTGNAAAALSGVAASVGQPNVIFVPQSAPEAKVAQLLAFGSRVMLVKGSYDQAFDLCMEACDRFGWYNRNTGVNPYMTEGKKTSMLEIATQLDGEMPDAIVVSVGDGCIIGGFHKGLRDLAALGQAGDPPRLIGVQSEGSRYLVDAFENEEDVVDKPPAPADTVADSISAGLPRDRIKAMNAVKQTGGAFIAVPDDEILAAIPAMARSTGVFSEPASAAAYAGMLSAIERGLLTKEDRVVLIATGSGLKDVPAAMRAVQAEGTTPRVVEPSLEAVEAALGS
ncbi:MAG: threonine synthase [Acidimicrobiia bacterium]|nr:threonine synthase [Acidimicrobiia bacterium]